MTSWFDDCNNIENDNNKDDDGHDNNNDDTHDNDDNDSDEDNDNEDNDITCYCMVNHYVKPTELEYLMTTHQTPAEYLQHESFSTLHHWC